MMLCKERRRTSACPMASRAIGACLNEKPEAKLVPFTVHSPSHMVRHSERHPCAG